MCLDLIHVRVETQVQPDFDSSADPRGGEALEAGISPLGVSFNAWVLPEMLQDRDGQPINER